jgi:hypothetical protein
MLKDLDRAMAHTMPVDEHVSGGGLIGLWIAIAMLVVIGLMFVLA